jgi:Zn-dependent protease with chaperone function
VSFAALGLAVCLAVHLLGTLVVSLAVAVALPRLEPPLQRLAPDRRASLLLLLALLPAGSGLVAVLGLALPAWLLHEPRGGAESPGPLLLALAAAGALLVVGRLTLALADACCTARLVRRWRAEGRELSGFPFAATRVAVDAPVAALGGIVRPRLLLSGALLDALLPGELDAVVEHERAHAAARENLKRLLLRASPDPLALWPAGRRLRAVFEEAAEAAADRTACARVPPLRLARALLKLAALAPRGPILEIAAAALHREGDLAMRVRALVHAHESGESVADAPRALGTSWLAAGLFVALLAAAGASLLPRVHGMLESLVHLLS